MKFSTGNIDKFLYIWLFIPFIIFIFSWLRFYYAIPCTMASIYVLYHILKNIKSHEIEIKTPIIIISALLCVAWCFFAGIGCLYYQSPDWHMRNAIFHDLINFSYPVFYDNGSSLVYYMGYFLPSTLVGKLFSLFGVSENIAFSIANIFCLLYSALGIFLMFLEICFITKAKNFNPIWVMLIFMFFSGLDILIPGTDFSYNHLEWHPLQLQYSSNTTQLFWVYNQAIATWAITLLFLRKPYDISNFGVLAVLSFFFAPLPFIGFAIYLIWTSAIKLISCIKKLKIYKFFKSAFSTQNIISVFLLLPIIYLYYKSNATATNEGFVFRPLFLNNLWYTFFMFEVGLYLIITYQYFYRNYLYRATFMSLIFISFFHIGNEHDFVMRASIPALLILMVFVIKFLFSNKQKLILIILLIISTTTPFMEYYRGFYLFNKEARVKDNIQTLNYKITQNCSFHPLYTGEYNMINWGNFCNYGTSEPEKTFFFKYLAKKNKNL